MGICILQNGGVVSVCCHTADSEENERFERANVFIGAPKCIYVKVFFQRCFRVKKLCLCFRPLNELSNGFIIEVDIGECSEKALYDKLVCFGSDSVFFAFGGTGEIDECFGQFILKQSGVGFFAANA